MSLDLTGIENINEFYTDHYLATYFEESVKSAVGSWKEAHEANGSPVPWRALKSCATRFYQVHERMSRATRIERAEAGREMASRYLEALGYDEALPVEVDTRSGQVFNALAEYPDLTGKPVVQVFYSDQQNTEDDIMDLGLSVDDAALEPVSEGATEAAVETLFFDAFEPARFIIVASAFTLMLFDRNKWQEKRCIRVDMEELFRRKEDTTFQAVATLLAKPSLAPDAGDSLLDELDSESRKNAASVSESLKYALRECIEMLGNEVIYDWVHNKGGSIDDPEMDEGELTIECLRYMYRMLFLLFMEARPELGFAPMKSESYLKAYSLESLREIAESLREDIDTVNSETNYIDQTMDMICRLVYDGYPLDDETFKGLANSESVHDVFIVPPLKAHIFDAERTRLISNARLRDCVMVKLIDRMSITEAHSGRRRERISYGTLGINQLGSVYEALLSYRGFIARQDLYEVKKKGDSFDPLDVGYFVAEDALSDYDEDERVRYENGPHAGELRVYKKGEFVYRLAGREREKSASFYTPESLTHCLVKYALKELLEGKTADEILNLTICEPAMGSAAFLNEAINQLAESYLAKKQEELGEEIPYDERALELQRVKMYIADRNVYGIDLNPIAVELGEVSLWLNTISQDGHVPWFGNQLHNGNSLIGARRRGYTEKALTSRSAGVRWYDREPERVGYETGCSKSHRIYHFLVGDPGMSSYKDKVVKGLEPDAIKIISDWNKAFTKPYDEGEIKSLRKLSYTIDDLWSQQIEQQRRLKRETQDALLVYGAEREEARARTTIREKDAVLSRYYRSEHARNAGPYARLKFAMDYWCALWFWPIDKAELLPTRDEYLLDMAFILEGVVNTAIGLSKDAVLQPHLDLGEEYLSDAERKLQQLQISFDDLGTVNLDDLCIKNERLAVARDIAESNHFFHWELEFADVFEARGGFDLILGNPPWIKLEWNEQAVLSDTDPRFIIKNLTADQTARRRGEALERDAARNAYYSEYVSTTGQKNYLNVTQNYPLLKGQQTNLYKCFLPQAWSFTKKDGISAFVHPDGVFNDPKGGVLRSACNIRLRMHFQFVNEMKLFAGVHHQTVFSLNSYGCEQNEPNFDSISNLFETETIEQCYQSDGSGPLPGIKTKQGNWEVRGHRDRIVHIGRQQLETFAALIGSDSWESARLLTVHATPLMEVLGRIAHFPKTMRDDDFSIVGSECWHETGAQKDDTIVDKPGFPSSANESIYAGANIGLANPILQCTRPVYENNSSYDRVDLNWIDDDYRLRTRYHRKCSQEQYLARSPKLDDGRQFSMFYHLAFRHMAPCTGERTVQGAILTPGQMWIHGVLGCYVSSSESVWLNQRTRSSYRLLAWLEGCISSLPIDYCMRASGKTNLAVEIIRLLPVIDGPLTDEVVCRALLLNCLTSDYADLWEDAWKPEFTRITWSKNDSRLPNTAFSLLSDKWERKTPLRIDYERRQALVEIDVLVSMAMGLTLDQLETVYRLDFSVLQSYEEDTWYDINGHVAFSKKNMGGFKLTRQEFEPIKDAVVGEFSKMYVDNTTLDGPIERIVEYVAPFERCNRVEDYRSAWAFFENKYGVQGGDK